MLDDLEKKTAKTVCRLFLLQRIICIYSIIGLITAIFTIPFYPKLWEEPELLILLHLIYTSGITIIMELLLQFH